MMFLLAGHWLLPDGLLVVGLGLAAAGLDLDILGGERSDMFQYLNRWRSNG